MPNEPASPELLLVIAMMDAFRALYGEQWCREHLVGRMRHSLSRSFPANVIGLDNSVTPPLVAYMAAQREAGDLLNRLCDACQGCELGRERVKQ